MTIIEKIRNIIKGRPCFVVAKGASLKLLKNQIREYKDLDVCWATLNDFHYIENTILCQINKQFDLVSDCATVKNVDFYENKIRIPRFESYLNRENNLLMLSELVVQQCFRDQKRDDLLEKYKDKIITINELFSMPQCPQEIWNKPPNSITLLYAFLIAGGAKKVVIFGLDGYQKEVDKTGVSEEFIETTGTIILSYYMPDVVKQERMDAFGDYRNGSLYSDNNVFNTKWQSIFNMYKVAFNNPDVQLYNCSPITSITSIPVIRYTQVKEIING
jgi:hypothetical protein